MKCIPSIVAACPSKALRAAEVEATGLYLPLNVESRPQSGPSQKYNTKLIRHEELPYRRLCRPLSVEAERCSQYARIRLRNELWCKTKTIYSGGVVVGLRGPGTHVRVKSPNELTKHII